MPLHLKQATLTFLEHLFLTGLITAIFAFSDYLSNHNQLDWHQVFLVLIAPVSVAILSSIKTFYQTQGDLAAMDITDQLTPRIQQIEQRLMQLQWTPPPQPTQPPVPPPGLAAAIATAIPRPPDPPQGPSPVSPGQTTMPPQGLPSGPQFGASGKPSQFQRPGPPTATLPPVQMFSLLDEPNGRKGSPPNSFRAL